MDRAGHTKLFGPWSRWALLATTLLAGLVLVATAWTTHRAVRAASSALVRGQADLVLETIRQRFSELGSPLVGDRLSEILEATGEAGVTYLAFYDDEGSLVREAGVPVAPVPPMVEATRGPPTLVDVGAAYRIIARLPGAGPPMELPGRGPGWHGGPGPMFRPGPALLVELEPRTVRSLARQTTRTLVAGLVAALLLAGAAGVFWRLDVERERAERLLERQRRLGALGEMTAVLAHEIKNPLASLKGHAQLLAERLAGDEAPAVEVVRPRIERVVTEAIRLETLVEHLLDFSRSGPVERQPTDLVELASRLAREPDLAGRVRVDLDRAPASWPLDPTRFEQVVTNLLRNAIQASGPDGVVELVVGQREGELVVEVKDRGHGLPAEGAERLFDPFVTTRSQGTGLGLAVSRRIVEMHGGRLAARSRQGGGAVFEVVVPSGRAG